MICGCPQTVRLVPLLVSLVVGSCASQPFISYLSSLTLILPSLSLSLTLSLSLSLSPPPGVPGVHVFGLLATALVTDVIQLATGYHAPFFLTVCQPNYTAAGVSCDQNTYITQDICSGKDQYAIMSAR